MGQLNAKEDEATRERLSDRSAARMATATTQHSRGRPSLSKEIHSNVKPGMNVSKLRNLFETSNDNTTNINSNKVQSGVSIQEPEDKPAQQRPTSKDMSNWNMSSTASSDFSTTATLSNSSEDDSDARNVNPHDRFAKAFKMFETKAAFEKPLKERKDRSPATSPTLSKRKYEPPNDRPAPLETDIDQNDDYRYTGTDKRAGISVELNTHQNDSKYSSKEDENMDVDIPNRSSMSGPMPKVLRDFISPEKASNLFNETNNAKHPSSAKIKVSSSASRKTPPPEQEQKPPPTVISTSFDKKIESAPREVVPQPKIVAKTESKPKVQEEPLVSTKVSEPPVKVELKQEEHSSPVRHRPKIGNRSEQAWKRRSFDEPEPFQYRTFNEPFKHISAPGRSPTKQTPSPPPQKEEMFIEKDKNLNEVKSSPVEMNVQVTSNISPLEKKTFVAKREEIVPDIPEVVESQEPVVTMKVEKQTEKVPERDNKRDADPKSISVTVGVSKDKGAIEVEKQIELRRGQNDAPVEEPLRENLVAGVQVQPVIVTTLEKEREKVDESNEREDGEDSDDSDSDDSDDSSSPDMQSYDINVGFDEEDEEQGEEDGQDDYQIKGDACNKVLLIGETPLTGPEDEQEIITSTTVVGVESAPPSDRVDVEDIKLSLSEDSPEIQLRSVSNLEERTDEEVGNYVFLEKQATEDDVEDEPMGVTLRLEGDGGFGESGDTTDEEREMDSIVVKVDEYLDHQPQVVVHDRDQEMEEEEDEDDEEELEKQYFEIPGLSDPGSESSDEDLPPRERKVSFSVNPIKVFETHGVDDYDRRNEDIDPVAASAEYELEKRVERMDQFPVQLNKGSDGLGLSIIGMGVGADAGLEKLGIFVKTITENGAAQRDGRINVNDQIIEVDGKSLVGVSQSYAATVLKNTKGTVNFLIGREKDGEDSEVAHLISQSLQQDRKLQERLRQLHQANKEAEIKASVEQEQFAPNYQDDHYPEPLATSDTDEEDNRLVQSTFQLEEVPSSEENSQQVTPTTDLEAEVSEMKIKMKEAQYKNAINEAEIAKLKIQVMQAHGWETEEKRLKSEIEVQRIRIAELEEAITGLSHDVKATQDQLEENKTEYANLEKKYHKAKKLIKDLQAREEELQEKERLQQQIQTDKEDTHQKEVEKLQTKIKDLEKNLAGDKKLTNGWATHSEVQIDVRSSSPEDGGVDVQRHSLGQSVEEILDAQGGQIIITDDTDAAAATPMPPQRNKKQGKSERNSGGDIASVQTQEPIIKMEQITVEATYPSEVTLSKGVKVLPDIPANKTKGERKPEAGGKTGEGTFFNPWIPRDVDTSASDQSLSTAGRSMSDRSQDLPPAMPILRQDMTSEASSDGGITLASTKPVSQPALEQHSSVESARTDEVSGTQISGGSGDSMGSRQSFEPAPMRFTGEVSAGSQGDLYNMMPGSEMGGKKKKVPTATLR